MSGISSLRNSSLFASLPDSELEEVAACLVTRSFGRGVFIFHKDSPGQTLYIIQSGRVRIFILSESGQEISLNVYGAGEVIGELGFLDGQPRSASAVTLEPTVTLALRREDFFQRLEDHPRLSVRLLEVMAARLRYTTAYAEGLAFLDVNGRVAMRLLELGDRFGVQSPRGGGLELDLGLTQAELASWVASSRETVNKVLSTFRDQGLIELVGQRITILDRLGLWRKICY
jgi:CRP/FNR family transcriptional regulator, cyclic AMP receptor protein